MKKQKSNGKIQNQDVRMAYIGIPLLIGKNCFGMSTTKTKTINFNQQLKTIMRHYSQKQIKNIKIQNIQENKSKDINLLESQFKYRIVFPNDKFLYFHSQQVFFPKQVYQKYLLLIADYISHQNKYKQLIQKSVQKFKQNLSLAMINQVKTTSLKKLKQKKDNTKKQKEKIFVSEIFTIQKNLLTQSIKKILSTVYDSMNKKQKFKKLNNFKVKKSNQDFRELLVKIKMLTLKQNLKENPFIIVKLYNNVMNCYKKQKIIEQKQSKIQLCQIKLSNSHIYLCSFKKKYIINQNLKYFKVLVSEMNHIKQLQATIPIIIHQHGCQKDIPIFYKDQIINRDQILKSFTNYMKVQLYPIPNKFQCYSEHLSSMISKNEIIEFKYKQRLKIPYIPTKMYEDILNFFGNSEEQGLLEQKFDSEIIFKLREILITNFYKNISKIQKEQIAMYSYINEIKKRQSINSDLEIFKFIKINLQKNRQNLYRMVQIGLGKTRFLFWQVFLNVQIFKKQLKQLLNYVNVLNNSIQKTLLSISDQVSLNIRCNLRQDLKNGQWQSQQQLQQVLKMYTAYAMVIKKNKRTLIYSKNIAVLANKLLLALQKPKRDKCFWLLISLVQVIYKKIYCPQYNPSLKPNLSGLKQELTYFRIALRKSNSLIANKLKFWKVSMQDIASEMILTYFAHLHMQAFLQVLDFLILGNVFSKDNMMSLFCITIIHNIFILMSDNSTYEQFICAKQLIFNFFPNRIMINYFSKMLEQCQDYSKYIQVQEKNSYKLYQGLIQVKKNVLKNVDKIKLKKQYPKYTHFFIHYINFKQINQAQIILKIMVGKNKLQIKTQPIVNINKYFCLETNEYFVAEVFSLSKHRIAFGSFRIYNYQPDCFNKMNMLLVSQLLPKKLTIQISFSMQNNNNKIEFNHCYKSLQPQKFTVDFKTFLNYLGNQKIFSIYQQLRQKQLLQFINNHIRNNINLYFDVKSINNQKNYPYFISVIASLFSHSQPITHKLLRLNLMHKTTDLQQALRLYYNFYFSGSLLVRQNIIRNAVLIINRKQFDFTDQLNCVSLFCKMVYSNEDIFLGKSKNLFFLKRYLRPDIITLITQNPKYSFISITYQVGDRLQHIGYIIDNSMNVLEKVSNNITYKTYPDQNAVLLKQNQNLIALNSTQQISPLDLIYSPFINFMIETDIQLNSINQSKDKFKSINAVFNMNNKKLLQKSISFDNSQRKSKNNISVKEQTMAFQIVENCLQQIGNNLDVMYQNNQIEVKYKSGDNQLHKNFFIIFLQYVNNNDKDLQIEFIKKKNPKSKKQFIHYARFCLDGINEEWVPVHIHQKKKQYGKFKYLVQFKFNSQKKFWLGDDDIVEDPSTLNQK